VKKVIQVPMDLQVKLEQPVKKVQRVSEEQPESAALRDHRDQQDQLANVVSAELQANVV